MSSPVSSPFSSPLPLSPLPPTPPFTSSICCPFQLRVPLPTISLASIAHLTVPGCSREAAAIGRSPSLCVGRRVTGLLQSRRATCLHQNLLKPALREMNRTTVTTLAARGSLVCCLWNTCSVDSVLPCCGRAPALWLHQAGPQKVDCKCSR